MEEKKYIEPLYEEEEYDEIDIMQLLRKLFLGEAFFLAEFTEDISDFDKIHGTEASFRGTVYSRKGEMYRT